MNTCSYDSYCMTVMATCSYECYCTCMTAIKWLLLIVIIGITFIAHALLYILPDSPLMAIAFILDSLLFMIMI